MDTNAVEIQYWRRVEENHKFNHVEQESTFNQMPKAIKVCHHSSNTFLSTRQIEEFIKDKANQTLVA